MCHKLIAALLLLLVFSVSCNTENNPIASSSFVDSIMTNYDTPKAIKTNAADLQFWKSRITTNKDFSNSLKYAAALIGRFQLLGNMADVKLADSILLKVATDFNGKETAPYFSLVSHYILQHRFKDADSVLQIANTLELKKYDYNAASFDVNYELGYMNMAKINLNIIKAENDFGYQFRKSKWMHYSSELDSAIAAMQNAVTLAASNQSLKLAALSNVGDLYIHAGKLDKAYQCFTECIQLNPADLHSLMGIGWVALLKDKNDSLAEKIFQFASTKTQAPDALYKLIAVAEQRNDTAMQLKYAQLFEEKTSNPIYGNMYNKYLLQLYTGILNNPTKALTLTTNELANRSTPQTYSWYAWALYKNNKLNEAMEVYKKYISGKPLEGLELYYMGKILQAANKGFDAKQYLEEAKTNLYDLSPAIQKELNSL